LLVSYSMPEGLTKAGTETGHWVTSVDWKPYMCIVGIKQQDV